MLMRWLLESPEVLGLVAQGMNHMIGWLALSVLSPKLLGVGGREEGLKVDSVVAAP